MKRGGPLKRHTPMRRTKAEGPSWEREDRPRAPLAVATVRPLRRGTYAGGTAGPAPKPEPMLQHPGYMESVRGLGLCVRCGRTLLRSVFCHRDCGKGAGLKTDCREGWAGCEECHYLVGTSGTLPKPVRRAVELLLAALTRALVIERAAWPPRLDLWGGATVNRGALQLS